MDKYFICLANSLKRGGRCVAGVEVNIDETDHWTVVRRFDGTPQWIRPIDLNTEFGEITNIEAQPIRLLSVIRLSDVEPCPHHAHSEDVYFRRMEVIGKVTALQDNLIALLDEVHQDLFYQTERSVSLETFTSGDYSLMLIRAHDIHLVPDYSKRRAKFRMSFIYHGAVYDLPITDPEYLSFLEKQTNVKTLDDSFLCLSLGMEYEGRHHKLIAGVITSEIEDGQPFTFHRKRMPQWTLQQERRLTKQERHQIKSIVFIPSYNGPSAYIRWRNGTEQFLPLENTLNMNVRERIAPRAVLLQTFIDEEGNTLQRLRIDAGMQKHLFRRLIDWLFSGFQ